MGLRVEGDIGEGRERGEGGRLREYPKSFYMSVKYSAVEIEMHCI